MLPNWYNKIIFSKLPHVCYGKLNQRSEHRWFYILQFDSIHPFSVFQLEFLESAAGTCTFGGTYVLALELVSSRYRVIAVTLIGLAHPIGEIFFGFLASYCHDFRMLLRIFYAPGLFLFIYFWLVPESIRWLLVTGRVDKAIKILKQIARVNQKHLSTKSIDMLTLKYTDVNTVATSKNSIDSGKNTHHNHSVFYSFGTVFKSKTLALRLCVCCYQWASCCFCYYGLNLSSTLIPGADRYVGFLFVVAAEIPGILLQIPLLKRFKRRILLFSTLSIAAISIVVTALVPEQHSAIVLIFFMIGKASMTLAFAILYAYSAEMWPTNLRNSIMNTCSMVGRVGSMVSPLTVFLVRFSKIQKFYFTNIEWLTPSSFYYKLFREMDRYRHSYLLVQQSLQLFSFSSIPKHIQKNYQIQSMKRNFYERKNEKI